MKEVIMPRLGLTMKKGTIGKWFKKEGERIEKDEPLFEVETEKITKKIEASGSGILRKIIAPQGSTVPVAEIIAVIAEPDEELPEEILMLERVKRVVPEAVKVKEQVKPLEVVARRERVRISPLAKKLAEEHGIDVAKIRGSGPGGRIVKQDVLKAVEEAKAVPAPLVFEPAKVAKVIPLTTMRKRIAERLTGSHLTAVHVTATTEVDMTETIKLRQALLREGEKTTGAHVSITDIIVKAVAKALREHPIMNSTLEEDQIKIFENIHMGVAVALESGLMVPVVRDADKKSLAEISLATRELAEKARQGTISLDEVTGSTFTITNLGMFGVDTFTPIINPPETGILGAGRIVERPIAVNGEIVVRSMMPLSLSFDHRVVDGALAAQFLQRVKQILENPFLLFI